jgi:trk system potassium uptake protein
MVVDQSQPAFDRLGSAYSGETLVCNGIDVDCLRRAGTEHADLFMALTDGDNRNLMAAQIARQLGVRTVLARVYDAVRAEIFKGMGVITVSPTIKGAERLFHMVLNDSGSN